MSGNNDSNAQDFVASWSTWCPGETRPTTFNAALNLQRYADEFSAYSAESALLSKDRYDETLFDGVILGAGLTPTGMRDGIDRALSDPRGDYRVTAASPGTQA